MAIPDTREGATWSRIGFMSSFYRAGLVVMAGLIVGCGEAQEEPLDTAPSEPAQAGDTAVLEQPSKDVPSKRTGPSKQPVEAPIKQPQLSVLFREITEPSGFTFAHDQGCEGNRELPETLGGGVAWLDYDGDGNLDLYLAQSGPLREVDGSEDRATAANEIWAGDGAGHFALVPGIAADTGYGQGVHAADFDGDGRVDLAALNWGRNGIWHSVEDGYKEVTAAWGMAGDTSWSASAAVLDYDGDGDLDFYVVNYLDVTPRAHLDPTLNSQAPGPHTGYPHPDRYPAQKDTLWRNDLDGESGAFVDVSSSMGLDAIDPQKGLGAIPTDIELDGWVDLYVANDATPNTLLHNEGGTFFKDAARTLGLAYNESGQTEAGMGVDTVDIDRDGDLDLFVTNLDMETNSLYLNRSFERKRGQTSAAEPTVGRLSFRDRTLHMGLAQPSRGYVGFGVIFIDADLDGDADCIVANGHVVDNIEEISDTRQYAQANQIYLNDGSGHFTEAKGSAVPLGFQKRDVSRGSALGDLDGDLDLDLCIANNGGPARIYEGTPAQIPRLFLRLQGPLKNTEGLGATVWLRFKDAPTWLGRMERSRSYASASEAAIVAGMPGELLSIEILWPGGKRDTFTEFPDGLATAGGALKLLAR
jgi:enediyne biosynthesis protein E4